MTNKILFVIAPEDFRDEELLQPKEVLEFLGAETTIASTKKGTAVGKLGAKVEIEKTINEINYIDFDAVVFVGGRGVETYKLYENLDVLKLARDFYNADKLTCAICIAPRILAMAEILKNKNATCHPDPASIALLKQHSVHYIDEQSVVIDGNIITANGPEASREFGEKIGKKLKL